MTFPFYCPLSASSATIIGSTSLVAQEVTLCAYCFCLQFFEPWMVGARPLSPLFALMCRIPSVSPGPRFPDLSFPGNLPESRLAFQCLRVTHGSSEACDAARRVTTASASFAKMLLVSQLREELPETHGQACCRCRVPSSAVRQRPPACLCPGSGWVFAFLSSEQGVIRSSDPVWVDECT